jgi:hypothetical protein
MPLFVMIGALFMTIALVLYTIGIATTVFTGTIKKRTVMLQTLAVCADAFGTFCMIVNSGWQFIPADFHGWLGYIALAGMVVDLVLVHGRKREVSVTTAIRIYSACIWILWIVSYSMGFVKMG